MIKIDIRFIPIRHCVLPKWILILWYARLFTFDYSKAIFLYFFKLITWLGNVIYFGMLTINLIYHARYSKLSRYIHFDFTMTLFGFYNFDVKVSQV